MWLSAGSRKNFNPYLAAMLTPEPWHSFGHKRYLVHHERRFNGNSAAQTPSFRRFAGQYRDPLGDPDEVQRRSEPGPASGADSGAGFPAGVGAVRVAALPQVQLHCGARGHQCVPDRRHRFAGTGPAVAGHQGSRSARRDRAGRAVLHPHALPIDSYPAVQREGAECAAHR